VPVLLLARALRRMRVALAWVLVPVLALAQVREQAVVALVRVPVCRSRRRSW
jgi:hypothetical protein